MGKNVILSRIAGFLSVAGVALCGVCGLIFSSLYIETFCSGFVYENSFHIEMAIGSVIFFITMLAIVCGKYRRVFTERILALALVSIFLFAAPLYFLKSSGLIDKIDSVEALREYIAGFGNYAVLHFIFIQFLQVVILPVPSFITVAAGVLIFGSFWGSIYSSIGIIAGSFVAYFIGKSLGYKAICWLIGENKVNKWLGKIKGKDKLLFTLMFLFPFFPDDVLCFIAGITTISPLFFTSMIVIVRIVTVFASSYSINNQIIPYNTWWGLIIWVLFFVFTLAVSVMIFKGKGKSKELLNKRKKQ